jgi:hypothetical protein
MIYVSLVHRISLNLIYMGGLFYLILAIIGKASSSINSAPETYLRTYIENNGEKISAFLKQIKEIDSEVLISIWREPDGSKQYVISLSTETSYNKALILLKKANLAKASNIYVKRCCENDSIITEQWPPLA